MKKKYFIITVDTEGDNVWAYKPLKSSLLIPETKNAYSLIRFQQLCEKYQFYPTYLVDYEMAKSPVFIELGRDILKRNTGEIGMHMHAFSTPPFYELGDMRGRGLAFAGEYPQKVLFRKMEYMTKTLQDTFQVKISSHRGGRWYLDKKVLKILEQLEYSVDCTVTPGISWQSARGQTGASYGSNYKKNVAGPYQIRGTKIWELPVTITKRLRFGIINKKNFSAEIKNIWMRPDGKNLDDMIWIVNKSRRMPADYIEFMIHSSELMEGENPTFQTAKEIEILYKHMDILFAHLKKEGYEGIGSSNYVEKLKTKERKEKR